ncbi:MAG: hypothetical protein M5T61_10405 [Acidimicrobiia bacterium]|nr:hypothetical protein [Acidimicrobiia bacterium]
MAAGGVKVSGLREFTSAVRKAQGNTSVARLGDELKRLAEPVQTATKGSSAGTAATPPAASGSGGEA